MNDRGQDMRRRVRQAEDQAILAKIFARRLWATLKARSGMELDEFLNSDAIRIVDPAFDAAQIIWEQHRIQIEPCRRVLDLPSHGRSESQWPAQADTYLGTWPDGTVRNLTRAQVLMMAGQEENL